MLTRSVRGLGIAIPACFATAGVLLRWSPLTIVALLVLAFLAILMLNSSGARKRLAQKSCENCGALLSPDIHVGDRCPSCGCLFGRIKVNEPRGLDRSTRLNQRPGLQKGIRCPKCGYAGPAIDTQMKYDSTGRILRCECKRCGRVFHVDARSW